MNILFLSVLSALCFSVDAAPENDSLSFGIDSIVCSSGRAGYDTPVVYSLIGKEELGKAQVSESLPMVLSSLPSVVTTNEGGTGLGYSNMRVRGVGGTQTNVTLNGVTLNDAESQEVFWVNIPALSSIAGSVQLQRGLGTSACGPGAFGASVNILTTSGAVSPAHISPLEVVLGAGSFGTVSASAKAATGIRGPGLWVEGFINVSRTDGYVRNAFADLVSFYAAAGWSGIEDAVVLRVLGGKQHTGITWEGCTWEKYNAGERRYNPSGEYIEDGKLKYYDNQTDNYTQLHFQGEYSHSFTSGLRWYGLFNYTRGDGYYEQLLAYQDNAVTRDCLANNLFVYRTALNWSGDKLNYEVGAYLSGYFGRHFGKQIIPQEKDTYGETAKKTEADIWAKAEWKPGRMLTYYCDLQYRHVDYMNFHWNFFNPRLGVTISGSRKWKTYASLSFGNREPARADIQAAGEQDEIKPEKMLDFEIGAEIKLESLKATANLYDMEYFDMLLETGRINEAGYPIKTNVPRGWRRGVELSAEARLCKILSLTGNLTFSKNRLGTGETILLSPSFVAAAGINIFPFKNADLSFSTKAVGRQYWDNSSLAERVIPFYCICAAGMGYWLSLGKSGSSLRFRLDVNDIFSRDYYAYAYQWGVFPQPPANLMFKVTYIL